MSIITRLLSLFLIITALSVFPCIVVQAAQKDQKTQTTNKGKLGEWVSNDEVKIRVSKVEEITKWSNLPFSKRYSQTSEDDFKYLKKAVDEGQAKFVLVTTEVKNISDCQRDIGYYTVGNVGRFHLRGDEGSEQDSYCGNQFSKDIKGYIGQGSKLPFFIEKNFPQKANVSPGGTVSGRVLFVVPSYFVPTVLFTKPYTKKLCFGKNEIIIKLK